MYAGGRGSKIDVHFFQTLEMALLFQQNHQFIPFFIHILWGVGGGVEGLYKKSTFCTLVKMMIKWATPYIIVQIMCHFASLCSSLENYY